MTVAVVKKASKYKFLDLKLSDLFWLLVINLLLFESTIQKATGFSYIDEGATIMLAVGSFALLRRETGQRMDSWAARMFGCLITVVFIGVASNYISGVNTNIKPILIDVFACIKFPLALFSAYMVFRQKEDIFRLFERESKALLAVFLLFGTLNLFVQINDFGVDPRYGLRASFEFVFGHPETLNLVVVGMLMVLVVNSEHNLRWIVVALTTMCFTLRAKGFAFVAIVCFLLVTWEKSGKLKWYQIVAGLIAALLIGYSQFEAYFTTDGSARNELSRVGLLIANDFFPLGSGFATYASNITASPEYYSPLYFSYGLSTLDGLVPGQVSFLSDVFWPIVIGQFGWIGLLFFCLMLTFLALFIYKASKTLWQRLAVIFCFVYLLISSTAGSAFFHPAAVYLACCLGLVFAPDEGRKEHPLDCLKG